MARVLPQHWLWKHILLLQTWEAAHSHVHNKTQAGAPDERAHLIRPFISSVSPISTSSLPWFCPFLLLFPSASGIKRAHVGGVAWTGFEGDSNMPQLADSWEQRSHWKALKGCRAQLEHWKELREEASSPWWLLSILWTSSSPAICGVRPFQGEE